MLITHSGRFHADEVFATSMVLMVEQHEVLRTRDQAEIDKGSIVLDVGSEYNPDTLRFDHHQNSFTREREDGTPFATAGLIWEHYGSRILQSRGLEDSEQVTYALKWVDDKLIKDIDAVDNGMYLEDPRPSVSMIIGLMNQSSDDEDKQLAAFNKAVTFTSDIMENLVASAIKEAQVASELMALMETVENGILILEKNLPYKDFISKHPEVRRVVYPRNEEQFGVYCNGRENHLPKRFRGLRDQELCEVTGLEDAVFCHKSGFMSVTLSLESALFMARSE